MVDGAELVWGVRSDSSFLHETYACSVAGGTFAFGGGLCSVKRVKLASRVKSAVEMATESGRDGASFCVNSCLRDDVQSTVFFTTILAPRGERERVRGRDTSFY